LRICRRFVVTEILVSLSVFPSTRLQKSLLSKGDYTPRVSQPSYLLTGPDLKSLRFIVGAQRELFLVSLTTDSVLNC
jgi:hypothetical protein